MLAVLICLLLFRWVKDDAHAHTEPSAEAICWSQKLLICSFVLTIE